MSGSADPTAPRGTRANHLTVVRDLAAPVTPGLEPTREENENDMAVLGSLSDRIVEAMALLSPNSPWRDRIGIHVGLLRAAAGRRRLHAVDGREA